MSGGAAVELAGGLNNAPNAQGLLLGFFAEVGFQLAEGAEVGDDGGDVIVITGNFAAVAHAVTLGGVACYSGKSGSGYSPVPAGGQLRCIAPRGVTTGAQDLVFTWQGGNTVTLSGAVTVRRRHHRTGVFELAQLFTAGIFAGRDPSDPSRQEIL